MDRRGYRIKCCDLSSYSAKHVFKNYKIKVKTEDIKNNSYEENSLDAVTCFDTIEHVSDFADITGYFNRWIKKGGFLFITTPNTKGWDARVFGKKWYGYTKIPEHLNYFSPENISVLLKKNGFEVEKIIPNWGFVRSLEFITGYLKIKTVSLKNIFLTVPMTDMMVVAKNVKKN